MLRKNPLFVGVAVATLALGIGANTAIFSMVDAVLLRPLPFPASDRLVNMYHTSPLFDHASISAPDFLDIRSQSRSLENLAVMDWADFNMTGLGEAERVSGMRVSSSYFDVLGIHPALGRTFAPEEDEPGRGRLIVLNHAFWKRRLGGQSSILGKSITLDGNPYAVIGILGPDAIPAYEADLFVPEYRSSDWSKNRGDNYLQSIGRLRPGVALAQAGAELSTLARRLEQQYPDSNANRGFRFTFYREELVGKLRPALLLIWGAVALVLLIACVNVANLLLARASARETEIALRLAQGASRARLVRQLLTESLLLALLGAGGGLLLALWGVDLLGAYVSEHVADYMHVTISPRVLAATLGLSLATTILFGLVPALVASKVDLHACLKEGAARVAGGRRQRRARTAFIVAEVALAALLLVMAGLTLRSFRRLQGADLGFDPHGVLTAKINLPPGTPSERVRSFYDQVLTRVQALPGVQVASANSALPLDNSDSSSNLRIEGHPDWPRGQEPAVDKVVISPDYFRAVSLRILAGRPFDVRDDASAPPVIIVSETLAKRFFPGQSPLGKRIDVGWNDKADREADGVANRKWREIVGVVPDIRRYRIEELLTKLPQIYVPYAQTPLHDMTLAIRTAREPMSLAAAVRAQVRTVDPDQPIFDVRPFTQIVGRSLTTRRLSALLLSLFAALAIVLAAVGIYGVLSYQVSQRTHEIGIRMALGARPRDVRRLVLGQGLVLALAGLTTGLGAALVLARLLGSLLYEVPTSDPVTYVLVGGLLAAVALLASYLPARRATAVDPMLALRYE